MLDISYNAAADEMIQYLKTENDRLQGQVDELKSELASIRSSSDEQHIHYQKLLMEESQKNKDLSEEIASRQKLEHNECSRCTIHEATVQGQQNSCEDTRGDERPDNSVMESMKKRKFVHTPDRMIDVEHDRPADQHVYGDKGSGVPPITKQPLCCQKKISSGADATGTSSVNCVFQYLVEFVVGMKISPLAQSNELCILAHHQSSGYSFSLTWIKNPGGEVETQTEDWAYQDDEQQIKEKKDDEDDDGDGNKLDDISPWPDGAVAAPRSSSPPGGAGQKSLDSDYLRRQNLPTSMAGREVREYTNLTDPKDKKWGKSGKDRIDDEEITFQRMVAKGSWPFHWALDMFRCKRLLENVEDTFMDVAVWILCPLCFISSLMYMCLSACLYCIKLGNCHYFLSITKGKYAALDSDDLLYLKEQMEAEEDAERLLRRTEKRAFAAFKISFYLFGNLSGYRESVEHPYS
ncbi:UNVERIFIED_CONTAM: hypothetical protein Scaly_1830600 [Sesamum calycinum]|uniref:DUF7806 domain-containing protein n=1 Tax=Sesamum calycinum TaxID=2727403 RepID=A0AAW2NFJ8_9LAMI